MQHETAVSTEQPAPLTFGTALAAAICGVLEFIVRSVEAIAESAWYGMRMAILYFVPVVVLLAARFPQQGLIKTPISQWTLGSLVPTMLQPGMAIHQGPSAYFRTIFGALIVVFAIFELLFRRGVRVRR